MGNVRVDASIKRLDNAGELIQRGGSDISLIFPGDKMFGVLRGLREVMRRGVLQSKETK
jgi:hypothetical protein